MSKKRRKRNWIVELLDDAFKEKVSEKDFQIVEGISKYYSPVFFDEKNKQDIFLINIAYQIGKREGRKEI